MFKWAKTDLSMFSLLIDFKKLLQPTFSGVRSRSLIFSLRQLFFIK